jgi:hypothetical protein
MSETVKAVIDIVQSLGFPIAMCFGACVFIKYQFDTNNKNIEEMRKEHKEEVSNMTEALTNNTIALTKLIDKLEK